MSDQERSDSTKEEPTEYQRTGAPGPGSPEYEAMDKLAKMFERQVDKLRGGAAPGDGTPRPTKD